MSDKPDWNLLLNLHQSIRHEQTLRATAMLAGLTAEAAKHAAVAQAHAAELEREIGSLRTALRHQGEETDRSSRKAAHQADIRDTIFNLRKTIESLADTEPGQEQPTIDFCEHLKEIAPSPSDFDQIADKDYCYATRELLDRTIVDLCQLRDAFLLDEFRRSVHSLLEQETDDPMVRLWRHLEVSYDSALETLRKNKTLAADCEELLQRVKASEQGVRSLMTREQMTTVESLHAAKRNFLTRGGHDCDHARIMELVEVVRSVRQHLQNASRSLFAYLLDWLQCVKAWEGTTLAPHLRALFNLRCMILVCKVEGQPHPEVLRLVQSTGKSIGLTGSEFDRLLNETNSIRMSEFDGGPKDAEELIANLVTVAAVKGVILSRERILIEKLASALKISSEVVDEMSARLLKELHSMREALEVLVAFGEQRPEAERWIKRAMRLHPGDRAADEWVRLAYKERSAE